MIFKTLKAIKKFFNFSQLKVKENKMINAEAAERENPELREARLWRENFIRMQRNGGA